MNATIADTRRVRRMLWALLIFGTASSVIANVSHALLTAGGVLDAVGQTVIGVLAPVFLLGLVHLLGLWSQLRNKGAVYWVFVLAIAALAAAAFRLSFNAVRALAIYFHYSHLDAALVPVMIDGVMVVCTVGLVALDKLTGPANAPAEPVRPAAVRDTDPVPATARTSPLRDAPAAALPIEAVALRDASAAEPATQTPPKRDADPAPTAKQESTLRDVEPSEPATYIAKQESTLRDADTVEIPLTSSASRDAAPVRRDVEAPKRRLAAVPPAVRDVGDERATSRSSDLEMPATQTDAVRDVDTEESAKQPAAVREAEHVDDYLLRAQQLVDAGRTTSEVVDVVRVLRRKAAGMSNRDVAAEVGISEAKVQRIAKADRELAGATA